MQVYLLQYFDAHDTWTQGVYSSSELAEKYLEENPEWFEGYAGVQVVEREVITK